MFEIRDKRLLSFRFSFLKTRTILAYFNSSEKVSAYMELFIKYVIGSAISTFAILIIFTGLSPLKQL